MPSPPVARFPGAQRYSIKKTFKARFCPELYYMVIG